MTQHGARLVFNNAKSLVENAGFNVGQAVLSQSYLRTEVAMSTSTTQYTLPILVNTANAAGGTTFSTTNLLNLQDAFVVSEIGIFTAIPAASTTTAFKLYTYPNAQAYTTAGAAAALYNLYNGQMSITVNNRQIMPSWDIYRHLFVPQTQQATSTGTNTAIDQNDASAFGYYPVEPNIVLVGSKNNQVVLNLPGAISTLQATTAPRIVVIFRGILAQNVTPVR